MCQIAFEQVSIPCHSPTLRTIQTQLVHPADVATPQSTPISPPPHTLDANPISTGYCRYQPPDVPQCRLVVVLAVTPHPNYRLPLSRGVVRAKEHCDFLAGWAELEKIARRGAGTRRRKSTVQGVEGGVEGEGKQASCALDVRKSESIVVRAAVVCASLKFFFLFFFFCGCSFRPLLCESSSADVDTSYPPHHHHRHLWRSRASPTGRDLKNSFLSCFLACVQC